MATTPPRGGLPPKNNQVGFIDSSAKKAFVLQEPNRSHTLQRNGKETKWEYEAEGRLALHQDGRNVWRVRGISKGNGLLSIRFLHISLVHFYTFRFVLLAHTSCSFMRQQLCQAPQLGDLPSEILLQIASQCTTKACLML